MDCYIDGFLGAVVLFYVGLFVGDYKLARLKVAIGSVVKKRVISHPSIRTTGDTWGISTTVQDAWKGFVLEVQAFVLDADRLQIETVVLSVSEAQYEEVSIEETVYAKYRESIFFKNKTLLNFAVLRP